VPVSPSQGTTREVAVAPEVVLAKAEISPDLEAPAEVVPQERVLPTDCASDGELCTPPADFARRLCQTSTPDLALTLFRKGTPWTRAYLRGDMEAWYVAEGARRPSSPKQLRYAEEVIVVHSRAQPKGGVQISGMDSYDVYRWDGTCVSVMAGELSFRPPATPDVAPIAWKRLDDAVQEALEKSKKIAFRNMKRREACREGDADRCEQAVEMLSRMIAEHLREGGEVPAPRRLP
jgi:hypothetical protein